MLLECSENRQLVCNTCIVLKIRPLCFVTRFSLFCLILQILHFHYCTSDLKMHIDKPHNEANSFTSGKRYLSKLHFYPKPYGKKHIACFHTNKRGPNIRKHHLSGTKKTVGFIVLSAYHFSFIHHKICCS